MWKGVSQRTKTNLVMSQLTAKFLFFFGMYEEIITHGIVMKTIQ